MTGETKATTNNPSQNKLNNIPENIDPSQLITVISGCQGKLIYRSPRNNEKFVWDGFGAEQEMELRELKAAKNSSKKFFTSNWWMFKPEDDWVIDYIGVRQFYKNAIAIDSFDNIFAQTPAALKKTIANLSEGQRRCVISRASEMIANGRIDSRKIISALEDSLGVKFAE